MSLSSFAGNYRAASFAYGLNESVGPLVVDNTVPSGAQSLTLVFGYIVLSDGTKVNPLATTAPITLGGGSAGTGETVTPSAVSASTPQVYDSTTVTATFAHAHGKGEQISSGTAGLQEAINYAASQGGGSVIVDARWTALGGTNAMIAAATAGSGVIIVDNRAGGASLSAQYATVVVANAAVKTLNATPVALVAAQGAGTFIEILSIVAEHSYLTGTFTGGSTLQAYYHGGSVTCTGTIATGLLAGPVANEIATCLGTAVAAALSSAQLNVGVDFHATSTEYAAGGGSLILQVRYVVHSAL